MTQRNVIITPEGLAFGLENIYDRSATPPVIYLTQNQLLNKLELTFSNYTTNLTLTAGDKTSIVTLPTEAYPSDGPTLLVLNFQGLLPSGVVEKIRISGDSWDAKLIDGQWLVVPTKDISLSLTESTTLTLEGISHQGQPRQGYLDVSFYNVGAAPDNLVQIPVAVTHLPGAGSKSLKDDVAVYWLNNNSVIYTGAEIDNELAFALSNRLVTPINFTADIPREADQAPKLEVSLSLENTDYLDDISLTLAEGFPALWEIEEGAGNINETTKTWRLRLEDENNELLGVGARSTIAFRLTNITVPDDKGKGGMPLTIAYKNFPGYDDGHIVLMIEIQAPQGSLPIGGFGPESEATLPLSWRVNIENGTPITQVGIGTPEPKSLLSVSGGAAIGTTYAKTNPAPANGLLVEGNVGIGVPSPGAKLEVSGTLQADKYVVQNSVDGGGSKGIWLWNAADSNWGIYMGTSGAGKSLAGGNAVAGVGFALHAIRLRTAADARQGLIYENNKEELNLSVRSSDGLTYIRGNVGIGTPIPEAQLHVGTDGLPDTGNGFRMGALGRFVIDARNIIGGRLTVLQNGNVGIGTPEPMAKLQVINANQDANGNTLILGPTNAPNLRLGYHANYSWIQSHGSIPLAINPIGNNVGIGTPEPKSLLSVSGGVAIGTTYAKTNPAPVNGLLVEGNVGIGTTSPISKLSISNITSQQSSPDQKVGEITFVGFNRTVASAAILAQSPSWDDQSHLIFKTSQDDKGAQERMRITSTGNIGIGTMDPGNYKLYVKNTYDAGAVCLIHNESLKGDADVLVLKVTYAKAASSNKFITFRSGETDFGYIQGDYYEDLVTKKLKNISFQTQGADYAEYLPLLDKDEIIEKGDIVGVTAGMITKNTEGAHQVMVISSRPIVVGNMPAEENEHLYEKVAFIGQVLVKVRGPVRAGDYIVPSGLNDGTGIAVPIQTLSPVNYGQVVGRAWESSAEEGIKLVNAVTGIQPIYSQIGELIATVQAQEEKISALSTKLEAFQALPN